MADHRPSSIVHRPADLTHPILLLLWAIPIGLFWLATLRVPLFEPRYMIIVLPFYLFFVAGGLLRLRAWHPALLAVGLLGIMLPTGAALAQVNYSSDSQKEDWRAAGDFVRQHERLRDVVIVYPGYLVTAVDYYRTAPDLPTVPVQTIPQLNTQQFGEREFNDALRQAIGGRERAWLIESPQRAATEDPQGRVLHWFQFNYHQFEERHYNGVDVYGFGFNGVAPGANGSGNWFPKPTDPQTLTFQNGLAFKGYIYELRNGATQAQNANWLPLTLYWYTPSPLTTEYAFQVELLDAAGKVRVRDLPLPPFNGYWPTTQWPARALLMDYRDVFLPGTLPPGSYQVRITVIPEDHPDQPLRLTDGSTMFLLDQPIQVLPWQGK